MTMSNLQKTFGATLTIALLAVFITGCASTTNTTTVTPTPPTTQTPAPSLTPAPTPAPSPSPTPVTTSTKYKSGSYTAEDDYVTPGGVETLSVAVTIKVDLVSAASFTANPGGPISKQFQAKFKAGYTKLVVGKNIDKVSLTVVNGSSLTPNGFMDALAKIKGKAKA